MNNQEPKAREYEGFIITPAESWSLFYSTPYIPPTEFWESEEENAD